MAIVDDTAPEKKGPSLTLQIGLLVVLTVVAIAIGCGSGYYLTSNVKPPVPVEAEQPAGPAVAPAVETRMSEQAEGLGVVHLDPIMTNLSGHSGTWVRMELALVFNGKADLLVAQTIQQDILGYLRTVKIHQVEGASGFQHLKSDIEERASIRSGGKVKQVLVRTLLFE
jgi:flagellar FliL protein